jgi:hypothetical protein
VQVSSFAKEDCQINPHLLTVARGGRGMTANDAEVNRSTREKQFWHLFLPEEMALATEW